MPSKHVKDLQAFWSHQHTHGSTPALLASFGSLGCFPQNKISVRPHVHRLSVAKLFECTSWFFAHKFSNHKWEKTANSHVQELLQLHLSAADLHRIDLRAKVPVYTLQRTKSTNSWIRGNCLVCLVLSFTHRIVEFAGEWRWIVLPLPLFSLT